MPQNGKIQLSNHSDASPHHVEWPDALYRIYALLHLLTYLHSWLRAYKTGNISKTVEDRAKVTINGLYKIVYLLSISDKMHDLE